MTKNQVGGILLPTRIMIGAGVCKSPQTARQWLTVTPVVSGSYTPEPRKGNNGARLFYPDTEEELQAIGFGLNSFGMPNIGFEAAAREFASYKGEQPLVVSIAGFSVEDYLSGVSAFARCASAHEFNFGCPNVLGHGRIMSFDLLGLEKLFSQLEGVAKKPIWVKFSPYSDPGQLKEVAQVVNKYSSVISAVVTCNTFPNAYAGRYAISPNNGLAGLSGSAMKPIALGQVVQFRQHLKADIDVIGVGGVTSGNDVVDFFEAGAQAVQMTSLPFWLGEPSRFWEALLNPETGKHLEALLTERSA